LLLRDGDDDDDDKDDDDDDGQKKKAGWSVCGCCLVWEVWWQDFVMDA
jgi:hypothetical protein